MASLRELVHVCNRGCGRRAVVELLTARNILYGRYCRRCGNAMLRKIEADGL